jgi:cobalt-zinc-cadmium efflux system outer membrane protein
VLRSVRRDLAGLSRYRVFCMVSVVCAPLVSGVALSQTPIAELTLADAVRLASRDNPTLRAKQLELRAAKANEVTAGMRPNPTASYVAEQLGGGAAEQQHTVTVSQPFELGGKRQRRLDSARAATRVTTEEIGDLQRQTILEVKKAFVDVLVAQSTLALAEANLHTVDEIERLQRLRVEKGDISALELTRIQVQRYAFERDATDARQAIAAARIRLRTLTGADAVGAEFTVVGDLAYQDVRVERAELMRAALDGRPDLRAAEVGRDKARADQALARANAWWDVSPRVEYQRIGPDNRFGFGFSVPIRIFDRNQVEITRTSVEIERADALRQAAVLQVVSDVDTALSIVSTERKKAVLLQDFYLPRAQNARDTIEFAYRRGAVPLLEFLDAQRTYRETAVEHLRALGNYRGALYQLEAAVGRPLEH